MRFGNRSKIYVSSIDTYTVHFSSCHDFEGPIVFNTLHYIKTIKSTHKTSLFFWVLTEKTLWCFLWNPQVATRHPSPTQKKHHKKPNRKSISIRIGRHLFGLVVHVGYIAVKRGDGRFCCAIVSRCWRLTCRECATLGGRGLVGKFKASKCANDGKFVFSIQMKPLEKASRNHLQFFKIFSKSWVFVVGDFTKQTLSTKNTPMKSAMYQGKGTDRCRLLFQGSDKTFTFQSVHLSQKHILCTNQLAVIDAWWRIGRFYWIYFLQDLSKKLIRVVPKQFTLEIV